MESKKLEKSRKNGAFSTIQGVMKPDEEDRGVFPTMKPLDQIRSSMPKETPFFGMLFCVNLFLPSHRRISPC